ncbi:uncharacterized protein LOC135835445 [Planococcus citri]|uniref:uncharacterized protein LOC135835445 n=1 Tax=Planococcus citri TaxID=170843 RepID=UPI0031F98D9D
MSRHLILILAWISCSTISFGSTLEYYRASNNSLYALQVNQSCAIICSDINEVEWKLSTTNKATNSIHEENPYRKIVKIEKATIYDTGVYTCQSKRDPNLFIRFFMRIFGGDIPGWVTPDDWRKTLTLKIQLNSSE